MIKLYFKQAWQVMKQNPFFSFVSVLSTAVTIAFVMVAYMAYDLSSSDLSPEIHRSRSLYSNAVYAFRTKDNGSASSGMSYKTARALTEQLPSVELVSYQTANRPYTCEAVGGEGEKGRRRGRYVDAAWFQLFQYDFIAGRPFTDDDFTAQRKAIILSERIAREMFHTSDVAGREVLINYEPYTVCGVVKDVSSQFSIAYCDLWMNFTAMRNILEYGNGSERVNGNVSFIALAKPGQVETLRQEIRTEIERFNSQLTETTFEMRAETHNQYTFSDFFDLSPALIYTLLAGIFLIVPAMNISGLISSMLDKRYEEIGVRKVYGASRFSVVRQFLVENLLLVVMGGVIGVLFSFLALYLFRNWLLGVKVSYISTLHLSGWMFFRPSVFLAALAICLLFNLLSTFIPVWLASRKNIVDTLKS